MRWRSAAIAAVAVLAVLGGALSIVRRGNQFGSGILPPTASPIADQLSVTMRDGEPTLIFRTGSVRTLILRSVTENKVLKHVDLDGTSLAAGIVLRSPLRYASDSATLLRVDITGDATSTAIALPGGKRTEAAKGHGALVALALAMADRYGVVVVVPGNQTRELSWDLQSADPMESASEALQGTPTVAERRTSGIIWLQ